MHWIRTLFGRGGIGKSVLFVVLLAVVSGCSALPQKDMRREYFKAARTAGLTPVFPPREEFQVGDVYYFVYSERDPDDFASTQRTWLGTLTSVREVANEYLASRTNLVDTNLTKDGNSFDFKPGQDDLISGRVTLNDGTRRSLLLESYPAITGAASTAASFGGFGFTRSFGLGLGRAETVSLDFGDTRKTGLPDGAIAIDGRYENEFRRKICPRLHKNIVAANKQQNESDVFVCPEGYECLVAIVTDTVVTRKFSYTYSSAAISQLAATSLAGNPETEPTETLNIPGNLDVNVTLESDPDGTALQTLVTSLNNDVTSGRTAAIETNGARFVGLRANGLVFDRTFRKPIAIAYDALAGSPDWFDKNLCNASWLK